jgi:hypothetical protein
MKFIDTLSNASERLIRVRDARRALDEQNRATDERFASVRPPPMDARTPHTPLPPPTIRQ